MRIRTIPGWLLVLSLAACGGGGITTVGGTVSGLKSGTAVTLQNNGRDTLVIGKDGPFEFGEELNDGDGYAVVIVTQPAGQTCTLANASGTVDANASKVTNINVTCSANFAIGGTVSGLAPNTSIGLQNNGGEIITVTTNGSFVFPTALATGTDYAVTISTQPTGKTCQTSNASGKVASADVTTVVVTCP